MNHYEIAFDGYNWLLQARPEGGAPYTVSYHSTFEDALRALMNNTGGVPVIVATGWPT
jgi:hypothetical protein